MAPVPEISEGSFEPTRDCFGSGKILAHAHAAQVTMKREHRCERRVAASGTSRECLGARWVCRKCPNYSLVSTDTFKGLPICLSRVGIFSGRLALGWSVRL